MLKKLQREIELQQEQRHEALLALTNAIYDHNCADWFCREHLKFSRLIERQSKLRVALAASVGVPAAEAHELFYKMRMD